MNTTIMNFGYPATLLGKYAQPVTLPRPWQTTLGTLTLAVRGDAEAFADLPAATDCELARVTQDIEADLAVSFAYDSINCLALKMADLHVHFRIVPRHSGPREYREHVFPAAAGRNHRDATGTPCPMPACSRQSASNCSPPGRTSGAERAVE